MEQRQLKLSECREIYNFCDSESIDFRQVIENITDNKSDFEVDDYRFIHTGYIDDIMKEELSSDPYIVGCFNAWFLADILGTTKEAIETMQKSDAFEGIGLMITSNDDYMDELVQNYISYDGYGHHFASYDGNEHEVHNYYAFRVN